MPLCSPTAAGSRMTPPRTSGKALGPGIPCAAAHDLSCTIIFEASIRASEPNFQHHSRRRRRAASPRPIRQRKSWPLAIVHRLQLSRKRGILPAHRRCLLALEAPSLAPQGAPPVRMPAAICPPTPAEPALLPFCPARLPVWTPRAPPGQTDDSHHALPSTSWCASAMPTPTLPPCGNNLKYL